jgi:ADP-heptose:LPS heptosyltransferase
MPRKLILKTSLSPGDICTLTAAIESLHSTYPDRFLTDVRTLCDELFLHNPRISKLTESDADVEPIEMHYTDLLLKCDGIPTPFLGGYCYDLGKKLGMPLELTTNRPQLYLSEEEKTTHPLVRYGAGNIRNFWLVVAGVKRDFPLKQWPIEYYQEVIDQLRGKVQFVQIGSSEDDHPSLGGVINLVGKTNLRDLVCLAYHADGGVGPISLVQHLCAAFEKPYVAILGGREPVIWTQYPLQTTLHTLGKLPCCRTKSCWRSRVVRLNDGSEQDNSLCELPVLGLERAVGKCMTLIKPSDVIRAIEVCYEGETLTYLGSSANNDSLLIQSRKHKVECKEPCLEIVAHHAWGLETKIEPAWTARDWMDATDKGFAYHCLPMILANQSGWFILAPHGVEANWNGGAAVHDLRLRILDEPASTQALSSVGSGILTWTIPYVFRTPPGWNLLCRGPANIVRDGIFPLEGLVETDWSFASFSMNWKFTRPGRCIFRAGEPIAMLVPHKRLDLEAFHPSFAELKDNPELAKGYDIWIKSRQEFWAAQARHDPTVLQQKFQKHYFRGSTNQGVGFPDHQKSRELKSFHIPSPARVR